MPSGKSHVRLRLTTRTKVPKTFFRENFFPALLPDQSLKIFDNFYFVYKCERTIFDFAIMSENSFDIREKSRIELNNLKNHIDDLYFQKHIINYVLVQLNKILERTIFERTLKKRLKKWNFLKKIRTKNFAKLKQRVHDIFFEYNLNDDIMFRVFEKKKFVVIKRVLLKIRKNMSIIKHFVYCTKKYNKWCKKALHYLNIIEKIDDFERELLYIYFRQ